MSAELIITVENDSRSIQARRRADEKTARGTVRGFERNSLSRRTIRLFEAWMRANKFSNSQEVAVFGQHLYHLLFDADIERLFEESLSIAKANGERLRLQLSFEAGAAELANLPWEFLHYPRGDYFLCSHVDLVLSRYFARHSRQTLRPDGTLRLLVAVSKPTDLGPVLEPRVIESIQRLSEAYPVQVEVLHKATVAAFTERMQTFQPHVLHFIGHGTFNPETGSGEVALLKPDETADWCSDSDFADWCSLSGALPRLVFLHLCEGGRADWRESFGGLAPRLVQKGVQAVVAMQYPITNMAAIDFSRIFYEALVRGEPLDYAVQLGRQAFTTMRQHSVRTFGTPVLYLHSADGLIQPADRSAVRPLEQPSAAVLTADDLLISIRARLERISNEARRQTVRKFAVQIVEQLEALNPSLWLARLKREWRVQFSAEGTPEQLDVLEAMMNTLKERGV
ncbi:MAG: CHAT domain-containing protein [Anaerolineae bacterium]|nr:CHAT domain-containing protein [Anaerolineae bacterium]MDW8299595.1 CHAT domain-containing protein [Anaerolineae bacterium]